MPLRHGRGPDCRPERVRQYLNGLLPSAWFLPWHWSRHVPESVLPGVAAVAIPIGRLLLRARREAVAHLPWHEMFRRSFWTAAGPTMKAIGVQMAVGMLFLSVIAGALTYVILVNLIRRHRAKLAAILVKASEREEAARAEQSPPPVD